MTRMCLADGVSGKCSALRRDMFCAGEKGRRSGVCFAGVRRAHLSRRGGASLCSRAAGFASGKNDFSAGVLAAHDGKGESRRVGRTFLRGKLPSEMRSAVLPQQLFCAEGRSLIRFLRRMPAARCGQRKTPAGIPSGFVHGLSVRGEPGRPGRASRRSATGGCGSPRSRRCG